MNKFTLGFLSCAALFLLVGMAPVYQKHEAETFIDEEFQNIYNYAQPRQFRVEVTSPTVSNVAKNEIFILVTDKPKLATRRDNTLYFVNFTAF